MDIQKLYRELSTQKPNFSFEEAKHDINTTEVHNLEIIYVLILIYFMEQGGTIKDIKKKTPYYGRKATKFGGIMFKTKNVPTKLQHIIINFLEMIRPN